MALTSWQFLVFFTVVFLLYFTLFRRQQAFVLLVASLVFYGMFSLQWLMLLLSVALISYSSALIIGKRQQSGGGTSNLITLAITLLLTILCIFKYTTAFISLLNSYNENRESGFNIINLVLPVGLSFYIFQAIGYMIDVHRFEMPPEKNFFYYLTCVSYFPHIMQGPIGQYKSLLSQLRQEHIFNYDQATSGVRRIAWGFFKKLVIANHIAAIIDPVFIRYNAYHSFTWWFVLSLYAVQLYADFSGYMDIILGCSKILDIRLEENFERPYFSKSIAEFWRRWHITLGQWFRNYLFYPLQRSNALTNLRKNLKAKGHKEASKVVPNVITLLVVWLCTGMWHGVGLTFVFWGLFHGFFIILTTLLDKQYSQWQYRHKRLSDSNVFNLFRIVRTFIIVVLGYAMFRAPDTTSMLSIIRGMFTVDKSSASEIYKIIASNKISFLSAGISGWIALGVEIAQEMNVSVESKLTSLNSILRYWLYVAFILMIMLLGSFGQSAFIYFAF